MANIQKRFGARVRCLREARDMSQKDLAADTPGLVPSYLSAVEAGRVNITLTNIERIAEGLGVDPLVLFAFDAKAKDITPAAAKKILDTASPDQLRTLVRLFSIIAVE